MKKILKHKSTHISKMIDTKLENGIIWYNSLSKNSKPLEYTKSKRIEGEYTFGEYGTYKGRPSFRYANIDLKTLENLWEHNYHLCEVITNDKRKPYFDIDLLPKDNEEIQLVKDKVFDLIFPKFNIDMDNICKSAHISWADGICKKKGKRKFSFHIIIDNGMYFENCEDQKLFMNNIKYEVNNNENYECLREGRLDFNVYGKDRNFKLPNQSKGDYGLIQQAEDNTTIYDYLIQYDGKFTTKIDTSHLEKQFSKKQIKVASGKIMTETNELKKDIFQDYQSSFPKDFKINIGEKESTIEYYLKSVPNAPSVSYSVFLTIGMCIKGICSREGFKNGLQLWCDWTSAYKSTTEFELKEMYEDFNTEKSYGWGMLYKLARIFNPKMESMDMKNINYLFNDRPNFPCDIEKINSRYITNIGDKIKQYDNVFIKSPMGTGKSYGLKKVFEDKRKSILYLSCKRSFSASMKKEYQDYGFVNYMDIENKYDIEDEDRIICSIESIKYCRNQYDIVIIDESETITCNMSQSIFTNKTPIENLEKFSNIFRRSKKRVIMDAYLSQRSFGLIKILAEEVIGTKYKSYYLHNEFVYSKRKYIKITKKELFVDRVVDSVIIDKKRVACCCGSQIVAYEIKRRLEEKGISVKYYDRNNKLEIGINVNIEWSETKCLDYSPTITAGISYDPQDITKRFDRLFLYGVNSPDTALIRDLIQAHKRVRNFNEPTIYCCLNDNFRYSYDETKGMTIGEVEEIETTYKSELYKNIYSIDTDINLDWFKFIYYYNILEKNLSTRGFLPLFERYLKEENIDLLKEVAEEGEGSCDEQVWTKYTDIKDFDYMRYLNVRTAIDNGESDTITEEEYQQYYKYIYDKRYVVEDLPIETKERLWNTYFLLMNERKYIFEIQRLLSDYSKCKYDFDNWFELEKVRREQNKYTELYDIKLKRREYLFMILDKLGYFKDNEFQVEHTFSNIDEGFIQLQEKFSTIPTKTINSLFINGCYINPKGKSFTSRSMNAIINNLLKDITGLNMISCGNKYTKINGKKKKSTLMKIQSELLNDNPLKYLKSYPTDF